MVQVNNKTKNIAVVKGNIENLNDDLDAKIKSLCEAYGQLVSYNYEEYKEKKFFVAFIEYNNKESVNNLIYNCNGKFLFENHQLITVEMYKEKTKPNTNKKYVDQYVVIIKPLIVDVTETLIMDKFNENNKVVDKVKVTQCKDEE